jgi:hypothetical protein
MSTLSVAIRQRAWCGHALWKGVLVDRYLNALWDANREAYRARVEAATREVLLYGTMRTVFENGEWR